ncbi:hypothetical protein [Rufibacter psychrotolerans]|uniref:hypothetical protein n=1 Tax=Rufibacter psychrotolerans TaxID=2812556 RepID=UPI0019689210|nr:hypothetical protein [Rufibacter sp. SYSU D00308]
MEINSLVKFYEDNLENLQLLRCIRKKAEDFYKELVTPKIKEDLVLCFFEMEKAAALNNLDRFFFNLQKQIEILIDYAIKNLITLERIKIDSKTKKILDIDGNETLLADEFFSIKYKVESHDESKKFIKSSTGDNILFTSIEASKELPEGAVEITYSEWVKENKLNQLTKYIDELQFQSLSISNKLNIFFIYLISNDPNKKEYNGKFDTTIRQQKLSYKSTNSINAFRIRYSHGNAELTEKQLEYIKEVEENNKRNLYFFYINYYKVLNTIYTSFNKNMKSSTLLM